MPRPSLTDREAYESQVWMTLLDRGLADTRTIAELVGLSQRRVQQRIKAAREDPDPVDFTPDHEPPSAPPPDVDPVHLELISAHDDRIKGGWYNMGDDTTSHDGTNALVSVVDGKGRRPRVHRLQDGEIRADGEFSGNGATVYDPPDDGLKGGKD